jgi:mannose-6-phosphate isomerase-like protein (cupin superfamily)
VTAPRSDLTFQPFAIAGSGSDVTGQMLRMDEVITEQSRDRDMKEQHFVMADGTGTMWLAHRYAYVRRS